MARHGQVFLVIAVFSALWLQLSMAWLIKLPRFGGWLGPETIHPAKGICAALVMVHGYKCQELNVETKDGYILSLQRIHKGWGRSSGNGSPVIFQHGLLVDGVTWFLNLPKQNFPMILADNGFDVWISNTRGTQFSRRHKSLHASQRDYWDWSLDELAQVDLPAIFDFVYSRTGNKKIRYVGHSLGTMTALAALSEGKIADKLISMVLLSPVAYLSHMSALPVIAASKSPLVEFFGALKIGEYNPRVEPAVKLVKYVCAHPGVDCRHLLDAVTGKNCCLNTSVVDSLLDSQPQSTSCKNMIHLAQVVRKGKLAKYDYEIPERNMKHYGEKLPPAYNLSNIPRDLPIFMSYGGQDALADPKDVQMLIESLKLHDQDKLSMQFIKDYAHGDFILAVNAKDLVFSQALSFFINPNH